MTPTEMTADTMARAKIIQRLGQLHYENAVLQGLTESQQQVIAALRAELEKARASAASQATSAMESNANG